MAALQTHVPGVTLLADTKLAAARAWGVLVPGAEHPTPATFVVADGAIRWRKLDDKLGDWPRYTDLAAALGR